MASQAHWHHREIVMAPPGGYEKRRQAAHHTGERPYVAAAGARQEKNDGLCSWLRWDVAERSSVGEPPARMAK